MTAVVGNENQLLSFPQSGTLRGVCCASLYFEELYDFILRSLFVKRHAYGRNKMCFDLWNIHSVCVYKSHQLVTILRLHLLFLTINVFKFPCQMKLNDDVNAVWRAYRHVLLTVLGFTFSSEQSLALRGSVFTATNGNWCLKT